MAKLFKITRFKAGPPLHVTGTRAQSLLRFLTPKSDYLRQTVLIPRRAEELATNLLLTTLSAPAVSYVLRSPSVTNLCRALARHGYDVDPNLLLTLLTTSAAAVPFVPEEEDWARPFFLVRQPAEQTQNLLLTLLGVNPQYVFGAPTVTGLRAIVPRRPQDSSTNLLLTLLAAATGGMPFTPTDWVKPTSVWRRRDEPGANLLLSGPKPPFPTAGILDAFNRADENPLANGTWGLLDSTQSAARVVSTAWRTQVSGFGSSYWSERTFGPDSEVYCDLSGIPSTNGNEIDLYVRLLNPSLATYDGYNFKCTSTSASTFNFGVYKVAGGSYAQLYVDNTSRPWAIGDKLGFSARGAFLYVWQKSGASPWVPLATVADATYSGAGSIGVSALDADGTIVVDNVGGGTFNLIPFNSSEWDVSAFRATRSVHAEQNLLLTTLVPSAATAPFTPADWSRGAGRLWRRGETEPNLLSTLLPTTLAPFSAKADWPSPPRVAVRVAEAVQNLLLTTLSTVPGTPFTPEEWGRPTSPSLVRQSEAVQNLLSTLLPTTPAPFTPFEWVVFRSAPGRVAEATQNPLLGPLSIIPQPMPFQPEEEDWNRLQWVPYRVAEATQNLLMTLLPTTRAPFASVEWSRPVVTPRRAPAESPNLLFTALQAMVPFAPVHWPRVTSRVSTDRLRDAQPNGTARMAMPPFIPLPFAQIRVTQLSGRLQTCREIAGQVPTVQDMAGRMPTAHDITGVL